MDIAEKQNKNTFPESPYVLKAEEINQIVSELQYIITLAGIVLDDTDTTQVYQALQILFATFDSTAIIDNNGVNEKTQAERNREYEAALSGGVTLAYPECYLCGGLLTYNSTTSIDVAASKSRSSDNTMNINVYADTLSISTAGDWASGSVPSLVSIFVYIWAVYNSGIPKYLFDDSTGTNIVGEKRLVAKLKTNASSEIILQTLVDFSLDLNSANTRMAPDMFSGTTKDYAGFTATENGWIKCEGYSDPGYVKIYINGEIITLIDSGAGNDRIYVSQFIFLAKGDICSMENTVGAAITKFIFYPCRGNI